MPRPLDPLSDDFADAIDAEYETARAIEILRQIEDDPTPGPPIETDPDDPLVISVNWRSNTERLRIRKERLRHDNR